MRLKKKRELIATACADGRKLGESVMFVMSVVEGYLVAVMRVTKRAFDCACASGWRRE